MKNEHEDSVEPKAPKYLVRFYNTDLAQKDWHMEPQTLQEQVNRTIEALPAGSKLVSLVPAAANIPAGFYLATFEIRG